MQNPWEASTCQHAWICCKYTRKYVATASAEWYSIFEEDTNMSNIKPISDLRNYTSVLKEVKYGERVYLTRNGVGECAIIDMKELDELDKMVALRGLMKDLDRAKARADREGWIDADEAERILG